MIRRAFLATVAALIGSLAIKAEASPPKIVLRGGPWDGELHDYPDGPIETAKLCVLIVRRESWDCERQERHTYRFSGNTATGRPEFTHRSVATRMVYTFEDLLEPVGLDSDGTIKHINELSFNPSRGWNRDA